jgi:dTDP-4-amino-4,6-dideoxygalactose transaminase
VIEDTCDALGSIYDGRPCGTFGDFATFSFYPAHHITTGEGGIVVSTDPDLARRAYLHVHKAWGYGDEKPDHYFLALNYRMSELQGAVAAAQLPKLPEVVAARVKTAEQLSGMLNGLPGIQTPVVEDGATHTYWKYCLRVDGDTIEGGSPGLGAALKERGIWSAPRYIQKPAFRCQVFRDQVTFGNSRYPFTLARPEAVDYDESLFPGTFSGLEGVLVMPWNEKYTDEHVNYIGESVREAVNSLAR